MSKSLTTFNPKSNRQIKVGTASFNKLIKEGYTFVDNVLIPPDTTDFAFSRVQSHWINVNSALYKNNKKNYEVKDKVIVPKNDGTVMGVNKRRIKIGSRVYKKLLDIGYTYDDNLKSLIYPINITSIPILNGNVHKEVFDMIRSEKFSHLNLFAGDLSVIINLHGQRLKHIKDEIFGNSSALYEKILTQIDFYESKPSAVHFGPSFDGEQNCVIKCIEEHYNHHKYPFDKFSDIYDKYKEGVFESDLEDISKKFKMRITVNINKKQHVFGEKRTNRASLTLYYHNNHMKLVNMNYKDKLDLFVDNLSFSTVEKLKDITNVIRNKDKIYSIETADTKYRLKIDEEIDLEKESCFSATSYYVKEFIKANPQIRCINKQHDNIDAIHSIVQNGIMFSRNSKAGVCIDLKCAYTNFKNFSSYTGFPSDLSSCVNTDTIKEEEILDIIDNYEGFALIECFSIFDYSFQDNSDSEVETATVVTDDNYDFFSDYEEEEKKQEPPLPFFEKEQSERKIKKYKRWVSFPYLRHRLSLSEFNDIQIMNLMIGLNRVHLNLEVFNDTPKRTLHKVFGKLINKTINNSFTTIDPFVSQNNNGTLLHKIDEESLYICNSWEIKVGSMYYPHITSYVQQYTEIEIEKKYLELRRNNIEVYRVWVDGIVVPPDTVFPVETQELWHIKDANAMGFMSKLNYVIGVNPCKYAESFNNLLYQSEGLQNRFLITGEAGTGKSYNIKKLFNQMSNSIILVYTHNLARNYIGFNVDTIQGFILKKNSMYENIFIDEYFMIGSKLFAELPQNALHIVVGDEGQLPCFQDVPLDISDYTHIKLKKNYRQLDIKFISNLHRTRECGDISWIKQKISLENALKLKHTILCATHDEIDRINKIGHEMNTNKEINGVKINTPVRFNKTAANYVAGDIGIIDEIEGTDFITILKYNGDKVKMKIATLLKKERISLAYAETIHGVQGKTLRGGLVINEYRMFDKAMPYVAVSRVVEEKQLFLLLR
jgi:hypothetical protein